jgi:hypothetical protein
MKGAKKSAKDLEQAIADVTRNGDAPAESPRAVVLAKLKQELNDKVSRKDA